MIIFYSSSVWELPLDAIIPHRCGNVKRNVSDVRVHALRAVCGAKLCSPSRGQRPRPKEKTDSFESVFSFVCSDLNRYLIKAYCP